jgi:hypothetical protein
MDPNFERNYPGFHFNPTMEDIFEKILPLKQNNPDSQPHVMTLRFNAYNPWDLPPGMLSNDIFVFSSFERRKTREIRTNAAGHWKLTGRARLYNNHGIRGVEKTAVFYTGRAPRGNRTEYVAKEYTLIGGSIKFIRLILPGSRHVPMTFVGSSALEVAGSSMMPPPVMSDIPSTPTAEYADYFYGDGSLGYDIFG